MRTPDDNQNEYQYQHFINKPVMVVGALADSRNGHLPDTTYKCQLLS